MTTDDHNKVLGILHLVFGGAQALGLIIFAIFFIPMMFFASSAPRHGSTDPGMAFFFVIMACAGLLMLLFTLPPLISGYGLLKKKRWAKTAAIVTAIITALGFPLGTALTVYTCWFLFGQGKGLYDAPPVNWSGHAPRPLYEAKPDEWATRPATDNREREYAPPPKMPDWR